VAFLASLATGEADEGGLLAAPELGDLAIDKVGREFDVKAFPFPALPGIVRTFGEPEPPVVHQIQQKLSRSEYRWKQPLPQRFFTLRCSKIYDVFASNIRGSIRHDGEGGGEKAGRRGMRAVTAVQSVFSYRGERIYEAFPLWLQRCPRREYG
jgi:hypothetical protein